jgi:hypothetical protein
MAEGTLLASGDRVVHAVRPEWGEGVVDQVSTVFHDGRKAQRVVVVFAHYGRITLNTAIAPLLLAKEGTPTMKSTMTPSISPDSPLAAASGRGWLSDLETRQPRQGELWALPPALTDPFAGLTKRLAATLDTYRFSADPRNPTSGHSLLEWATMQTGLADPLTKYTRHDLELAFPRFARDRDNHLFDLVRTFKREGKLALVDQVLQATALPAARAALEKARRA